jgi:hypothetical protein
MHPNSSRSVSAYLVFSIVLLVYLLAFTGFASTDDEQLFSTLTANLAHNRGYSALPLFGNDRLQGESGGVEPLHPILGIPFYLVAERIGLGKVQVLFLLPALYTALTAALLVMISEVKGYPPKITLLIGLIYGLATIAFPYARTNFREPLAALLITIAILCFEKSVPPGKNIWENLIYSVSGSVILILSVLTKITTIVLIPFLLVSSFRKKYKMKNGTISKSVRLTLISGFFAVSLGLIFISILPKETLSRFNFQFLEYIRYTLPRIPHDHFWSALAGLFFSPGKGLFIYSPIFFLLFVPPFFRRYKKFEWIVYCGALLALASVQALIYDEQWWSISWGTRALLPALPLACLASLPVLDAGIQNKNNVFRFSTFSLIALSVLSQMGRLLTSDPAYANWVVQNTGRSISSSTLWDPRLAPMIQHWRLAFTDQASDIAWLYINWRLRPMAAFLIGVIFLGLIISISYFTRRRRNIHNIALSIPALALIALCLTPVAAQYDQRYNRDVRIFNETKDQICAITREDDLVLFDAYLTPFWWYFSNFGCEQSYWVGLPFLHYTAINSETYYPRISEIHRMIQKKLTIGGNVFLISPHQHQELLYVEEFANAGFSVTSMAEFSNPNFGIFSIGKEGFFNCSN